MSCEPSLESTGRKRRHWKQETSFQKTSLTVTFAFPYFEQFWLIEITVDKVIQMTIYQLNEE